MSLTVRVNEKQVNGEDLKVVIPGRPGSFFEYGKNFELTDEQLKDPAVIRLLPRSYPGGRMGDLVIVEQSKTTKGKS